MIGTKLAHFELTAHLGSGGMGDVYQATDIKLGRSVAVKFLPEVFSHDAQRVVRFQREARVLASLNHPNIAGIYGVEEIGGRHFLVMELVPGETLADRIRRGAIPVEEALAIAKQIAEALEEAHEKGVVHRDLKPANIKVIPDGKVKVLDFGLAKAYEREHEGLTLSDSPTLVSMAATNTGVILGTAAYMSPEQAAGKTVDKRSDLWSFGVVLLEMLTGRAVFEGETVSHILASVLKEEPDWKALPANTAAPVRRLLRRCLKKDRKQRLDSALAARLEIEDALTAPAEEAVQAGTPPRPTSRRLVAVALAGGVVVMALLVIYGLLYTKQAPAPRQVRFPIQIPENARALGQPAISPDGNKVAFLLQKETGTEATLWIRDLQSPTPREITGVNPQSTAGSSLIWSPDSRSIAFYSSGRLRKVSVEGGPAQTLCETNSVAGGDWTPDGVIFFGTAGGGIMRVSDSGGTATRVTHVERASTVFSHRSPQLLPDGRLLFEIFASEPKDGIYVTSLSEPAQAQQILPTNGRGGFSYIPPRRSGDLGTLLYTADAQLMVQAVDASTLKPIGGATPFAEGVASFSASLDNVLVYSSASANEQVRELAWVDRSGRRLDGVGAGQFQDIALSPDGKRIAYSDRGQGGASIWIHESGNTAPSRLTFDSANNRFPVWSPDNQWLVFSTGAGRAHEGLIRKDTATFSKADTIISGGYDVIAMDWSPDGKFLIYRDIGEKTRSDLWLLPTNQEHAKPLPYLQTPAEEFNAKFSPDGRWVAYQSDELGALEVFVQSFPVGGGKFQVSTKGGRAPRWRRDGRELLYISPDGDLVSVKVDPGPRPVFGTSQVLFRPGNSWDISPDGNRIVTVISTEPRNDSSLPFTVILNWRTPAK